MESYIGNCLSIKKVIQILNYSCVCVALLCIVFQFDTIKSVGGVAMWDDVDIGPY